MLTFKEYVSYELKHNPFYSFSSLIFGVGGWLFGFMLGFLSDAPKGEGYYETNAAVLGIVVTICLFLTYDRLHKGHKLQLMREHQANKEIARINGKLWDGAER